jgi:hypothetical protein
MRKSDVVIVLPLMRNIKPGVVNTFFIKPIHFIPVNTCICYVLMIQITEQHSAGFARNPMVKQGTLRGLLRGFAP